LSYEKHIVGISIVIFGACVGIPAFGEIMAMNPVNIWFLNTIDGLYNAPLLKWLIGFCGIIFMFSMFQRAISTIQQLILNLKGEEQEEEKDNPINKIMDEFQKMNTTNQSFNKDDKELDIDEDMYVDFEEMEEDQEKEKK
jgi:hypothetical protein